MIRHLLAVSLAAFMSASPAIALAQSDSTTGTISTYSDTIQKRGKSPLKASSAEAPSRKVSAGKTANHKAAPHKTASKLRKSKATAASAR